MKTTTRNVSIAGIVALLWSMTVSWGGTNGYVQVWGTSDYSMSSVPNAALSNSTALAAGWHHCLALANGRVYAWGDNESGQTDVSADAVSGVSAIAAGAKSSAALKNGQIVLWGKAEDPDSQKTFLNLPTNGPYKAVALGANHGLAIREDDGKVEAWGDDRFGKQSGPGRDWTVDMTAIAAGKEFSMGLNVNGKVFVSGNPDNVDGVSLGVDEIPEELQSGVTAIAAGPYHAMALKGGRVWVWGAWKNPDSTNVLKGLTRAAYGNVTNVPASAKSGVTAIAAGLNTCAALKEDGSVVIWGNEEGSGSVHTVPSSAAKGVKEIALGFRHAMARTTWLAPSLTTTELPDAYLKSEYAGQLTAIGDPTPTFYVKGNLPLPKGLALNKETGSITGIPEREGTNRVYLAATNIYGEDASEFILVVHPQKAVVPTWVTKSLPSATVGTWYEVHLEATGDPAYYSVDPDKDPLPAWAELTSDGIIRGWPEGVGKATPTFIAGNEAGTTNRLLTLSTVNPTNVPVMNGQGALPDGIQGEAYGKTNAFYPPGSELVVGCRLDIVGASQAKVSSGKLPTGLSLRGTNGVWWIEGTPEEVVVSKTFEISASNVKGTSKGSWSITVNGPPVWDTPAGALDTGRVGTAYKATIKANGATNYVLASGAWPTGLSMSLANGDLGKDAVISGTPTKATTTPTVVGLRAVNAYGSSDIRNFSISILSKTAAELVWTGIRPSASNSVILSWTNKAATNTTAWIGSSTNLTMDWATNASPSKSGWIKTNSPAVLPRNLSPCFYLLRSVD